MTRAVLILGPKTRETALRWISMAQDGTRLEFCAPRRTIEQNALLWALLTDVSRQVEWYGAKLSPDDWKDVFSASLRKARVVPGLDSGTFVPLGMRTSDMSKPEMSAMIELIHAFGAEKGVIWSEPAGGSIAKQRGNAQVQAR